MSAAAATPEATAAEARGGNSPPADALSAAGVGGSTLAELRAGIALLSMTGLSAAERRPWDVIEGLVPWYAQASRQSLDAVYAMPATDVIADMRAHMPTLVTPERFAAIAAECARLAPALAQMLRRS